MNTERNKILYAIFIVALFIVIYIRNSIGWYDHDEFAHVNSLRHFKFEYLFSVWQRPGFKLFYLPFYWADVNVLRLVNLGLLGIDCWLLWKIAQVRALSRLQPDKCGINAGVWQPVLIFLSMPFVMMLGCRFYSETLMMFLMTLAIYFYTTNKKTYFALVVSYMPLVRVEAVLLFIPSIIYLWREK